MPDLTTMPMDDAHQLAAIARAIIDKANYMTLATADVDGRPWASPVWYAPVGCSELLWLSRPSATHSRNLAVRGDLAIVIFDSEAPIGTGQGVYIEAVAEQVPDTDLERSVAVYSQRSQARGGPALTLSEVRDAAPHRLYRALASAHSINGQRDERVTVNVDARGASPTGA